MILIQINPKDIANAVRAIDKLEQAIIREEDRLPMECAVDFYQLMIQNIMSEKYSTNYAPYSVRYSKRKQKEGKPFPGWWKYSRELVGALTAFKVENGWMGGIPASAYNTEGRQIAEYGGAGEFKDVREEQPARPVFYPSMIEFSKNGLITLANDALLRIAQAWK